MSTSDVMNVAQRRLAEHAFDLKRKYGETYDMTKPQFLRLYNAGEIQLSSVFENLLVAARNVHGLLTERASAEGYDFVKVNKRKQISPLGDMKTCTLGKDGIYRRFVVRNVYAKVGWIYIVGYNWMTDGFNYFAIPPEVKKPKSFMVIGVNRETGAVANGIYSSYECASFEDMIKHG